MSIQVNIFFFETSQTNFVANSKFSFCDLLSGGADILEDF